jgi:hypothetical protein
MLNFELFLNLNKQIKDCKLQIKTLKFSLFSFHL